jgi:hypothetical protein
MAAEDKLIRDNPAQGQTRPSADWRKHKKSLCGRKRD